LFSVQYRIVAVTPDLLPAPGSMTVYVRVSELFEFPYQNEDTSWINASEVHSLVLISDAYALHKYEKTVLCFNGSRNAKGKRKPMQDISHEG